MTRFRALRTLRFRIAATVTITAALASIGVGVLASSWAHRAAEFDRRRQLEVGMDAAASTLSTIVSKHPTALTVSELFDSDGPIVGDYVPFGAVSDLFILPLAPDGTLGLVRSQQLIASTTTSNALGQLIGPCIPTRPVEPGANSQNSYVGSIYPAQEQTGPGEFLHPLSHEVCGDRLSALYIVITGRADVPGWAAIGIEPGVDSLIQSRPSFTLVRDLDGTLPWIALGVTVIAALVSYGVAGTVEAPVAEASTVARRISEGDFSARFANPGRDELGQMGEAMNQVADRLNAALAESERAREAQRRFVADAAHELRTPVSALVASATALEDPTTREAAASKVVPELRRLASLTENLLEISRLDAGHVLLATEWVDLHDLARETVSDFPGVALRGEPAKAITDPVRVRSILSELLTNATRYGASPIVVSTSRVGRSDLIEVTDAGSGVPEDLIDKVFDRFVQADSSRHGPGTGLGLAIARQNAELLGGRLELDADRHTFRLTLPSGPAPAASG